MMISSGMHQPVNKISHSPPFSLSLSLSRRFPLCCDGKIIMAIELAFKYNNLRSLFTETGSPSTSVHGIVKID
jgi:hypothetical protein